MHMQAYLEHQHQCSVEHTWVLRPTCLRDNSQAWCTVKNSRKWLQVVVSIRAKNVETPSTVRIPRVAMSVYQSICRLSCPTPHAPPGPKSKRGLLCAQGSADRSLSRGPVTVQGPAGCHIGQQKWYTCVLVLFVFCDLFNTHYCISRFTIRCLQMPFAVAGLSGNMPFARKGAHGASSQFGFNPWFIVAMSLV